VIHARLETPWHLPVRNRLITTWRVVSTCVLRSGFESRVLARENVDAGDLADLANRFESAPSPKPNINTATTSSLRRQAGGRLRAAVSLIQPPNNTGARFADKKHQHDRQPGSMRFAGYVFVRSRSRTFV